MSEHSTGAVGVCPVYNKAAFPSPRAAERRRKRLKHNRGDPLQVYRCTACRKWHLGHSDYAMGERRRLDNGKGKWR